MGFYIYTKEEATPECKLNVNVIQYVINYSM